MRTLCRELGSIKCKAFEFGVMLGIPVYKLMEFKKEDDPLALSLDYWLKGMVEEVSVSWRSVVEALESDYVEEKVLAEKIKKTYCKQDNLQGKGYYCKALVIT